MESKKEARHNKKTCVIENKRAINSLTMTKDISQQFSLVRDAEKEFFPTQNNDRKTFHFCGWTTATVMM